MAQHSAVLKKGSYRPGGARRLGSKPPPPPNATTAPTAEAGEPDVRIVQERPDGVVLEVRCSCGRTTLVQCDYAPAPPAPAPAGDGAE